jgi:hypothetical protein
VDPAMPRGKGSVSVSRDEIRAFVPGEPWVSSSQNTSTAPQRPISNLGEREVFW